MTTEHLSKHRTPNRRNVLLAGTALAAAFALGTSAPTRKKEPAKQSQPHSPQEHTFSGNLIWTSHVELRCYSVAMRSGR
jgi:hypothetical protein